MHRHLVPLLLVGIAVAPACADPVSGGTLITLLAPGLGTLQSAVPAVATAQDGTTLIAWVESGTTPVLKYALFDPSGVQVVAPTVLNPGPMQEVPVRCSAGAGPMGFYVVFDGPPAGDPRLCVWFRSFNLQGNLVGSGLANLAVVENQARGAVAGYPNGDFIVSWCIQSVSPTGTSQGVFVRRFTFTGGAIDPADVRVDTQSWGKQNATGVAVWPSGRAVVVWQDGPINGTAGQPSPDGHGAAILGRWYTAGANLTPAGPQIVCNAITTEDQFEPLVAADDRGTCIIGWCGDTPGSAVDSYVRRFNDTGTALAATDTNLTPANTINDQLIMGLATNSSGESVATWMDSLATIGQPAPHNGFARLTSSGAIIETGLLDTFSLATEMQSMPRVGMDQFGNFRAAWQVGSMTTGAGVRTRGFRRNTITFSNPFPQTGTLVTINLDSPSDPNALYVVAASLGTGPIPLDSRIIRLDYDFLMQYTLFQGGAPFFANLSGNLDGSGLSSSPQLYIPQNPALSGTSLYFSFVTGDTSAPSSVGYISDTYSLTIL